MLVKLGCRGEPVVEVQRLLKLHGYDIDCDGIFGNGTHKTVKKFQQDNGLGVDGVVGKNTFDKLKETKETNDNMTTMPWLEYAREEIGIHEVTDEERVHHYWKTAKLSGLAKYPATEVPWCFDGDMEIMTELGFIKFKDLKHGVKVYQVDDDKTLSLVHPTKMIAQEYSGTWKTFSTHKDTYICTENHKWWGMKGVRKTCDYHELGDLTKIGMKIPKICGSEWDIGYEISDSDIIKAVLYMTDGTLRKCNTFDLQISKERKIQYCDAVGLHMNVYTQSKVYGPKTNIPLSVYSYKIPQKHASLFNKNKTISWQFINALNEKQARVFLDTFAMFDGTPSGYSKSNPSQTSYYTNNKQTADQIQFLLTKLGRTCRFESSKSPLSGNVNYTCCDRGSKRRDTIIKGNSIDTFTDSRMMYCVEVPNHKIVVRGVNGNTPLITGNCSGFVCAMMEKAGIRSARTDGAKNWLNWGEKLEDACDGCIVVFTRSGGGHVGIVVGEDEKGNLLVLGGNQGNAVNVKSFSRSRVTGYRYPTGYQPSYKLSEGDGTELSDNEA